MSHHVVLEAAARRRGLAAVQVDRFALAWAPGRGFELSPLQEQGPRAVLLATGEHVQALFESSGYWLEATSFNALFNLDDRVRTAGPAVFLVRDPGSGRVGVCTTEGEVLGPPVFDNFTSKLTPHSAGRLLAAAAPIGYRALTSPELRAPGARVDEAAVFARAAERVWSRQGVVNVRDVQDWALARADGDRSRVSKIEARLSIGANGFFNTVRLTAAISLLRDHGGDTEPDRPTVRRSASASASLSWTASRHLGQ